ncbi:MAG TPA: peptidylprolyl isomerase [Burkholderiales bacterium]|nr:peptidylprolyl isomerase [Burkholderiales bacterium]
MRSMLLAAAATLLLASSAVAQEQEAVIQTSLGRITIALDAGHAPLTVANFIRYANEKHFDGTVVYRVVPGFVLQMGSYDADGRPRPTEAGIPLEANNGLSNIRGSVAMARGDDPSSATAEFFISLSDNSASLDHAASDAADTTGYAVFGHVTGGMDVADRIAAVPLGGVGPFAGAAPMTPVVIENVSVVEAPPVPPAATELPPDTR